MWEKIFNAKDKNLKNGVEVRVVGEGMEPLRRLSGGSLTPKLESLERVWSLSGGSLTSKLE